MCIVRYHTIDGVLVCYCMSRKKNDVSEEPCYEHIIVDEYDYRTDENTVDFGRYDIRLGHNTLDCRDTDFVECSVMDTENVLKTYPYLRTNRDGDPVQYYERVTIVPKRAGVTVGEVYVYETLSTLSGYERVYKAIERDGKLCWYPIEDKAFHK